MQQSTRESSGTVRWAKVIDHTRCIGCHACTTACKSENDVPLGVTRTYVKSADVGVFPQARRAFQVTRCNQCADAPCTTACPTGAMFRRGDGIVDFDKSICIGCKACIAACPYDAIFINPEDHSAEKCNFCAHRIDMGLEPACVTVCPTGAILIGDLENPDHEVTKIVGREPVAVRRPEKETHPTLFYKGTHQATLDPLAAVRPSGGIFMWSEQPGDARALTSGYPAGVRDRSDGTPAGNSSAAAMLSYDVRHSIPWDWRVSLYTLTKGIAAGAYLVPALLVLTGALDPAGLVWRTLAPFLALAFLAITGAILVWDLEHPERFYMIFTKARWESWLVRGAFVIAGYGLFLVLHFLLASGGAPPGWLLWAGVPLAGMTAVYTAYLFAQAKARDLWQNPLLPPHFLVKAGVAGAGALLVVGALLPGSGSLIGLSAAARASLEVGATMTLTLGAAIHLLLTVGEITLTHPTAHARLATHEMVRGRYAGWFWIGALLVALAAAAPWILPVTGWGLTASGHAVVGLVALLGLLAHDHAYVQAGQSVPLA